MSARDDDGQALTAVLSDTGPAFPGTLRDWFAGQVLAGISTSCADQQDEARWAYSVADAMLAERAKVELTGEPVPGRTVTVCDYADCGEDALPGEDDNGMHGCEVHFLGLCGEDSHPGQDRFRCQKSKGHEGDHWWPRVDPPTGAAEYDPARLGEMERGQAPDEPAAEGRTDHAASPAPASVPRCLNCGLVLDSARDYCLVCGCKAWLFSQRESDIKCTLRAGHDGDHLNGAVSWGGSS